LAIICKLGLDAWGVFRHNLAKVVKTMSAIKNQPVRFIDVFTDI
jgi:hypothetical protein